MILASGYEKKRKLERGVHWNIEYIDIEVRKHVNKFEIHQNLF